MRDRNHSVKDAIRSAKISDMDRPVYFNVMCCGEENLGKSDFITGFQKNVYNKKKNIDKNQHKITEYIVEKNENGLRFVLNLIDSPGYNTSNRPIKEWYYNVKEYIIKKMKTYKELKKISAVEKNLNKRNLVDCRVHVLLYFFTGRRLKVNDVIYMKKLQKYTTIIPIYSNSDPDVDAEEIEDLKECIKQEAQDYHLNWAELARGVKTKDICNQNGIEHITPYPPFYFYNKDLSEINDPDQVKLLQNDFKLQTILIMGYLSVYCTNNCENLWYSTMERLKKKKKKARNATKDNHLQVGVGMALGLGVLGAIFAVKNKLI